MAVCWIGIGANVGDPRATFDAAWLSLAQHSEITLLNRSGIYHTRPVGAHADGIFSNGVFSVSTSLPPIELLDRLQATETELGRTRHVRWGSRTLDLDLLFADQLIIHEPRLNLPHPAAWYRRFVTDPLVELVPSLRHPLLERTLADLRNSLLARPLGVAYRDEDLSLSADESQKVEALFPEARLVSLAADAESGFSQQRGQTPSGRGSTIRRSPDGGGQTPLLGNAAEASQTTGGTAPAVYLRLDDDDFAGPFRNRIPVADLTGCPGNRFQRMTDFLTSVFDQPQRISSW